MNRRGVLAVAVLAAACGEGRAPLPPFETLPTAADTLVVPWGAVQGAPLPDGRWAVVAPGFDAAGIADLRAGTFTPLGGDRQQAYLHPNAVFTRGDTIYVADWGRRRTTVWTAGGQLIDSIAAPDATRGILPRTRDAAAQFYFEVPPPPGRDGSGNRDSAVVVRAAPGLARFDTVARLAPLELAEMIRSQSRRFERRVFSGTDLWGIWNDGTLWVARVYRNRIQSIAPRGESRTGPELPDPVYEVTAADREHYLANFPADVRPAEGDLPWALIHPPFVAAFQTGAEEIWLEKSKPALDSLRRIHVLDREGRLRRILQLVGRARLVAVGNGALLVSEVFPDGIRLMEIPVPAPPPGGAGR